MLKQIKFLRFRKTNDAKKALLICFPRTGSTTLSNCFRLHPDINLGGEVFNKTNPKFSSIVHSIDDFYKNVYDHYNVFQLKYTNLGSQNFKSLLLQKEYIILVLYRKNSFDKVISSLIAQKLKDWNSVEKIFEDDPFELDKNEFQKRVSDYKNDLASLKRVLERSKQPYRVIAYEDIFSPSVDITKRMEIFFEFMTYFGFEIEKAFDEIKKQRLLELLSDSSKINNISTYSYIRNYDELYSCFGNEFILWENGKSKKS